MNVVIESDKTFLGVESYPSPSFSLFFQLSLVYMYVSNQEYKSKYS